MSDIFGFGEAASAVAGAAAAITVATLQYRTWQDQINKQDAIARRIQDRLDERHEVWQQHHLPGDKQTLAEVYSEPKLTVDYVAVRARVEAQYRRQFAQMKADALRCMPASCVGAACDVAREIDLRATGALAFAVEAAVRGEEARVDLKNRQRLADRFQMMSAGNGVFQSSVNAMEAAARIHSQLAQQAAGAFNGAAATAGAAMRRAFGGGGGQDMRGPRPTYDDSGSVRVGGRVYQEGAGTQTGNFPDNDAGYAPVDYNPMEFGGIGQAPGGGDFGEAGDVGGNLFDAGGVDFGGDF